jgi:hypothetical protein
MAVFVSLFVKHSDEEKGRRKGEYPNKGEPVLAAPGPDAGADTTYGLALGPPDKRSGLKFGKESKTYGR